MLVFNRKPHVMRRQCVLWIKINIFTVTLSSHKRLIKHGGVVPELASRAHLEILQNITQSALIESEKNF